MKCCLCSGEIDEQKTPEGKVFYIGWHNAQPLKDGRCCDNCNKTKVIPERIKRLPK